MHEHEAGGPRGRCLPPAVYIIDPTTLELTEREDALMTLDEILAMPPGDEAFEAMRALLTRSPDPKALLSYRRYTEWLIANKDAIIEWGERTRRDQ